MRDVKRLLQGAAELTRGFVNYPDPDYGRDAAELDRLAALLPDAAELAEMAKACSIGSHLACLHDLPEDEARLLIAARLLRALSGEQE